MPRPAHRRRSVTALTLLAFALPLPAAVAAPAPEASAAAAPAPTPGWAWPLPGPAAVSRPFGLPDGPYAAGHRGVDLVGEPGTVVTAAGAGVVVFAGTIAGRPLLSIDHPGGLRTTYEPVQPSVGAGTAVDAGTPVGVLLAGHAGCPAAACLHWGLRRGETYLDPLTLLAPTQVRLLPWT
ncbi:murein hydrolase activator EnvC family protein [Goekera deserti]|uniref:murein hydrolase activator EnvC family protein n=1 Tax=Goekera deserti TaxID=2497753 RepID=UPI001F30DF01|nr:M23 family metallopeptidase [Goekera deserti]